MNEPGAIIPRERIAHAIHRLRAQNVMLDSDLAGLYGVEVKALNQAVRRNPDRFPGDFMFQLTQEESEALRSQIVTLNAGRGQHSKYLPYAFTEQGVAMLSSVLRSKQAVLVNVEIMRSFVRLRQMLASNAELAEKLAALEKKYDAQFKSVFDAIRQLMTPPAPVLKRSHRLSHHKREVMGTLFPKTARSLPLKTHPPPSPAHVFQHRPNPP